MKASKCSYTDAYRAAVVAIKANEAISSGGVILFQKEWFDI
jgi:hypothetical protein